jgi:hypothetical protein
MSLDGSRLSQPIFWPRVPLTHLEHGRIVMREVVGWGFRMAGNGWP